MAKNSIIMLTQTDGQLNVSGQAVKAAGYFGYARGIHTICWYLDNFTGRVYVEGSLATNPGPNDWFPIWLESANPYVQYPLNPNAPTGISGDNGIGSYTFQANLVWLRIRIDRCYIINPVLADLGAIDQALLNY
jgi:hypothetical protein